VTTAAPPATPKTKQTTEYVVLRDKATPPTSNGGDAELTVIQTVRAKSAHDAIRQVAGKNEGTYRAIPARSFAPVKVTVHTETTIRLG
jgi:hypothetical protein